MVPDLKLADAAALNLCRGRPEQAWPGLAGSGSAVLAVDLDKALWASGIRPPMVQHADLGPEGASAWLGAGVWPGFKESKASQRRGDGDRKCW